MTLAERLNRLKDRSGLSWNEIVSISGVPESTLHRVLNGNTANPGFDTVEAIVTALGFTLNDLCESADETQEGGQVKAVESIKAVYELRISDLMTAHSSQLAAVNDAHAEHIADIKKHHDNERLSLARDKSILGIVAGVLMLFIMLVFLIDILNGTVGWFRY